MAISMGSLVVGHFVMSVRGVVMGVVRLISELMVIFVLVVGVV